MPDSPVQRTPVSVSRLLVLLTRKNDNGDVDLGGLRAESRSHLHFSIKEMREAKMQPSVESALRGEEILKA